MTDYDKIDSLLTIEVRSIAFTENNPALMLMLIDVMRRATGYGSTAKRIVISVFEPEKDGSTTFHMHVEYANGGGIHIGCLRRTPFAETEFHS